jgi:hypothetical protein
MQFTDNGFVISGHEILYIVAVISLAIFVINLFRMTVRIRNRDVDNRVDDYLGSKIPSDAYKSGDYPISTRYSDSSNGSDAYINNELDVERRDKVIFEEMISGVIFRYDEKTRILSIRKRKGFSNTDEEPIEMELDNGIEDFRELVDRLEEYVNE